VSAELAARRTAAATVLGAFRSWERGDMPLTGQAWDWRYWTLRLAAELRSLLGQLDPEQAPPVLVLSESNEAVLGQALADAIAHRTPQGICPECDKHPAGLCEDHAGDLDKTDAYLALARELGIEVSR
jgi:hypothetical protein